jgi:hypothetical protein
MGERPFPFEWAVLQTAENVPTIDLSVRGERGRSGFEPLRLGVLVRCTPKRHTYKYGVSGPSDRSALIPGVSWLSAPTRHSGPKTIMLGVNLDGSLGRPSGLGTPRP